MQHGVARQAAIRCRIVLAAALLASGPCIACGDSTEELPRDKPISELSPTQAMRFCRYLQDARTHALAQASAPRVTCLFKALTMPGVLNGLSIDRKACAVAVDACVAETAAPPPVEPVVSCELKDLSPVWSSCELPLGTALSCFDGATALGLGWLTTFDCEHVDPARPVGVPAAATAMPASADCDTVTKTCPNLMIDIVSLPRPLP